MTDIIQTGAQIVSATGTFGLFVATVVIFFHKGGDQDAQQDQDTNDDSSDHTIL